MKIFSQSAACALIAVASVTAAATTSASANASAFVNSSASTQSSASAHSSASAKSSASATLSATANAFGFNIPTINWPTVYNRQIKPIGYQPPKPTATQYNNLMKFNTDIFTTVDLPDCNADGTTPTIVLIELNCFVVTVSITVRQIQYQYPRRIRKSWNKTIQIHRSIQINMQPKLVSNNHK